MRVNFEKPSASGSVLRVQGDVKPIVADMVAWAIMSDPKQVQGMVDAYLQAKALEEGAADVSRLKRFPLVDLTHLRVVDQNDAGAFCEGALANKQLAIQGQQNGGAQNG